MALESTTEDLRAAIERAAGDAAPLVEQRRKLQLAGESVSEIQKQLHQIATTINPALIHHPAWRDGASRAFFGQQLDTLIFPDFLSPRLLEMCVAKGIDRTITWLLKVCTIEQADMQLVFEVFGIFTGTPWRFANDVWLDRMEALTHSRQAMMTVRAFSNPRPPFKHVQSWSPPVAVYVELDGVRARPPRDDERIQDSAAYRAGMDVIRGLSVFGNLSPVVKSAWFCFIDPDLEEARGGFDWIRYEGGLDSIYPTPVTADDHGWADTFLKLPEPRRRDLRVAIDRLTRAKRRFDPADQAIDGATALEAMLGDKTQKTEMTHKIKTRAALLLGLGEERRKIRKEIGDFYNLRSRAVHGAGEEPNQAEQVSQWQTAKTGIAHCEAVLKKIVECHKPLDFTALDLGLWDPGKPSWLPDAETEGS